MILETLQKSNSLYELWYLIIQQFIETFATEKGYEINFLWALQKSQ